MALLKNARVEQGCKVILRFGRARASSGAALSPDFAELRSGSIFQLGVNIREEYFRAS